MGGDKTHYRTGYVICCNKAAISLFLHTWAVLTNRVINAQSNTCAFYYVPLENVCVCVLCMCLCVCVCPLVWSTFCVCSLFLLHLPICHQEVVGGGWGGGRWVGWWEVSMVIGNQWEKV